VVQGNVLLTGYPGFIGRRLADRLVEGGAQVTALVEPRMTGAAREASGGRVEIVEGDIAQRRLGLADADWERLTGEVRNVFHLAAVYDLGVPLELAQRVNVDGTGNVLELCRACERLERLNYVSTAYVAGVRRGIVYEHELTLGQDFKNHYESTKFQAEVWVRQELDRVPTTIYRPAIVVGDSRTGDTQKFDGPYFMLRVISYAERHGLPIPQFGRSNAPFNVVPVDFVLDAMLAGAREPAAVGQTFHLVDPEPVTAAELLRILAEAYAGRAPSYRLPAGLIEAALLASTVRAAFGGAPRESIRYLNHPVRFDARRAADVLGGAAGLRVPRFAEYAPALVRFFREHEDDPAYSVRGLGTARSG
jgi:nucleoside-diphosphate-sugar epimerase